MPERRNRDRPMTARLSRVRRSAAYTVERLAEDSREAYAVELDGSGTILLHGDGRETWEPPVRVDVSDAGLRRHLLSMAGDARDVFPDVDAVQAAYQLFLVHLDEEIATSAMPGSVLTLGRRGIEVDPVRDVEVVDRVPGDHHWSSEPPADADGRLEFLSPERFRARYGHDPVLPPPGP